MVIDVGHPLSGRCFFEHQPKEGALTGVPKSMPKEGMK